MPVYLDLLLGKAFKVIPGTAYNKYRQEAEEKPGPRDLYFEVSLMEDRPWEYLRDRIYPSFTRYLKHKKKDPYTAEGVTVAVFRRDHCHLISGRDFLEVFQEMEGLDQASLRHWILRWLS